MAQRRDSDQLGPRQQELVEKAVEHLRSLVFGARMEMVLHAAKYLLTNFFEGRLEKALSQRGDKVTSLRALSLRAKEFGMTALGVNKAIPVMQQHEQLGARIGDKLAFTHHVLLLAVENRRVKKVLAEAAIAERWSVQRLRAKVRELQDPHPGGRPPAPVVAVFVDSLLRQLERRDVLAHLDDGLSTLAPQEVTQLLGRIGKARSSLGRMETAVRRLKKPRRGR